MARVYSVYSLPPKEVITVKKWSYQPKTESTVQFYCLCCICICVISVTWIKEIADTINKPEYYGHNREGKNKLASDLNRPHPCFKMPTTVI